MLCVAQSFCGFRGLGGYLYLAFSGAPGSSSTGRGHAPNVAPWRRIPAGESRNRCRATFGRGRCVAAHAPFPLEVVRLNAGCQVSVDDVSVARSQSILRA